MPTRTGRRASGRIEDAVLAGLAAGAGTTAALAVTHVVARAVPFPPVATAQALARAVPGPVATVAIDRLQHATIPLFVSLVGALFFAWGPIVGALATRILPHFTARASSWLALLLLWATWSVVARPVPPELRGVAYALATLPSVLLGAIAAAAASHRSPASAPSNFPQVPRDPSGTAFALGKAAQWSIWLEAIRRFGVALYLASIAFGLATIITVLRFQAIRISELPNEPTIRSVPKPAGNEGARIAGPLSRPSAPRGHADVAAHSRSIGRNEPAPPPVATSIAGPTCQAWTPRYLAIWARSEASSSAPTWM